MNLFMNNQSFKSLKKYRISKIPNNPQISKISNNPQISKAFTVIELVIAIIIFWTGLLAILTVLNKNLVFAKKVELKTQATFLAKEGMEFVYNLRDSNVIKYYPWNYLSWELTEDSLKNHTYEKFEVWKKYIPYLTLTGYKVNLKEISNIKKTKLYKLYTGYENAVGETIYSGIFYNYFTWKKTPFYRYIMFSWVYLKPEGAIADENQILRINSKVFYSHWSLTWEVVLSSFIGNWR